jgi:hypothetical protein
VKSALWINLLPFPCERMNAGHDIIILSVLLSIVKTIAQLFVKQLVDPS